VGFLAFDAGLLLRRSEQQYTRLVTEHSREGDVREFVICVRQKGGSNTEVLGDWLPVAELALVSEQDASVALPMALPILCRYASYKKIYVLEPSRTNLNHVQRMHMEPIDTKLNR
jgi:hypothetical protein